jgi:hypothetical protein
MRVTACDNGGDQRSDGRCELVEGHSEPVAGRDIGSEFMVAAAQILHECMTGGQYPRGSLAFEAAHRPQPGFQPPVTGFRGVTGVPLGGVRC